MVFKRHNPGCSCDCESCTIFVADFDNPTSALDDWDVVSGTASIDDIMEVEGQDALVIANTPHPQYPYPPRLRIRVKGGDDSQLRALISWDDGGTDGESGFIAELRPNTNCGELRIIQVTDGVETILRGPISIPRAVMDEWHNLSFCYDPRNDGLTVYIVTSDGTSTTVAATAESHSPGEYAGFGTGPDHVGIAYFDDFIFDKLYFYGEGTESGPCATVTVETLTEGTGEAVNQIVDIHFVTVGIDDFYDMILYDPLWDGVTPADQPYVLIEDISHDLTAEGFRDVLESAMSTEFGITAPYINVTVTADGYNIEADPTGDLGGKNLTEHGAGVWFENPYGPADWYTDTTQEGSPTGRNEVQKLTVSGVSGAVFKLQYGTETTGVLTTDSLASEIGAALEALSGIGADSITISKTVYGWFSIQFVGDLANTNVDEIVPITDEDCYELGYYTEPTNCGSCGPDECEWIDARFDNSDNLACEWFTEDGTDPDWEIDETEQVLNALNGGALLNRLPYPNDQAWYGDNTYQEIAIVFKASAADQIIRGIVCATDDQNYIAAEIKVGTGNVNQVGILKIIGVSGGSESDLCQEQQVVGVIPGEWYTLYVKFDEDSQVLAVLDTDVLGDFQAILGMAITEPLLTDGCDGDYVGLYGDPGVKFAQFLALSCQNVGTPPCYARGDGTGFTSYPYLDDNWVLVAGDSPSITTDSEGQILGQVAEWDAGESGVILSLNPVHVDIENDYRVSANFRMNAFELWDGSLETKFGIVFASDATGDNYYLAEVATVAGYTPPDPMPWVCTLSIYSVSGGTKTELDSIEFYPQNTVADLAWGGITATGETALSVCWSDGTIIARSGTAVSWIGGQEAFGRYHGVSVEASATYAAWATSTGFIQVQQSTSDSNPCPPCSPNCSQCENNEQPPLIIGTVAGLVTPTSVYYDHQTYGVNSGNWETVNADHYCYPVPQLCDGGLRVACNWMGPPVSTTLDLGFSQDYCFWLRLWFDDSGGYPLMHCRLYAVYGNGPFWEDFLGGGNPPTTCQEQQDSCESYLYGYWYEFDPISIADPGEIIDCYEVLDGLVFTEHIYGDITVTINVPGSSSL